MPKYLQKRPKKNSPAAAFFWPPSASAPGFVFADRPSEIAGSRQSLRTSLVGTHGSVQLEDTVAALSNNGFPSWSVETGAAVPSAPGAVTSDGTIAAAGHGTINHLRTIDASLVTIEDLNLQNLK